MRVAIIPARGGSRRIPRKNIREFHGKPIIAYSIEAAKASGLFDDIVVSTDDDEIEEVALALGADVFRRDSDDGERGTQEVTAEVLRDCDTEEHLFACCIYPTAPLLVPADLRAGFDALTKTYGVFYAFIEGWLYWGLADAFRNGTPLRERSLQWAPRERWIDINTEEDWKRAEEMYAALRPTQIDPRSVSGPGNAG